MDKFDEDDFLPTAEERKKDPYRFSSLGSWFELDTWEEKEAACLICDIEPTTAEIKWSGYSLSKSDSLKLISARFLREDAWSLDGFEGNEIDIKKAMIAGAELGLRKYWRIYLRATDRPGDFGTATPVEYVAWAISRGFIPSWLDWAINNELLPDFYAKENVDSNDVNQIPAPRPMLTKESVATPARKTINTNTPERQEEKEPVWG